MTLLQAVFKRHTHMNLAIVKRMKKSTLLFHHVDIKDKKKLFSFSLIEYDNNLIQWLSPAEIAQLGER